MANAPRIIKAPQLGVNETTARLIRDLPEGEWVKHGAVICHLETVKATFEVESDGEGFLLYCLEDGAASTVNEPLLMLCATREQLDEARTALREQREKAAAAKSAAGQATDRARRRAEELGVDLTQVTSAHGIIQTADVEKFAAARSQTMVRTPVTQLTWPAGKCPVVIYGAGIGGLTVRECIDAGSTLHVVAFVDDQPGSDAARHGLPLYHSDTLPEMRRAGIAHLVLGMAGGKLRLKFIARIRELGFTPANAVHPTAFLSPSCRLGEGLFIKAGAIIETCTTIGDACVIDNGVVIPHHNTVGEGCHLAPGVSLGSSVDIGACTVVGIGASISSGCKIGRGSIVTPGSSVVTNFEDFSVIEGVPGKRIGEAKG